MNHIKFLVAIGLAAVLLAPPPAMAGAGHDHGEATPTASGSARPRFAAASELFELVGVLDGKQITLYLDRTADNSPVTEAQIELEISGQKFKAARRGADEFEVLLPEAPKPGVLQITATVRAGTDADLLAGELDIHESALINAPAHVRSWKEYAAWAAAGIVLLPLLLVAARRVMSSRQIRVGGAA